MSYYLQAGTYFETQYKNILKEIITSGRKRDVRGFKTIELSPFVFSTKYPLCNILSNSKRNINKAFSIAEWLWMMSGRNDVEMVSFYNSKISNYSDDGIRFKGAYGPRIKSQFDYIVDCFKKDINTRQAVVQIWTENPKPSKDIPCTLSLQFIHNDGELDLIATMRSNDAWLGLPYDFYNFTMIQNYLAYKLNLKIGRYTHQAGSQHLYEEHFLKAKEIYNDATFVKEIKETEKIEHDELNLILSIEESLRKGQNTDISINILHEPWLSMAKTLKQYSEKKYENKKQIN